MKKGKKLLCMLLAVILCFSVSTPAMAASASYTKAKKAYTRWLNNTNSKYPYRYYDIVDIDGNGIPELMTSGWGESRVYTYNVKKSKMILLKKYSLGRAAGPMVTYNTKKKSFTLYQLTTGDYTMIYYTLNGTKTTRTATYQWQGRKVSPTGTDRYLINGTVTSHSTYIKKLNSAKSGFTALRYQM